MGPHSMPADLEPEELSRWREIYGSASPSDPCPALPELRTFAVSDPNDSSPTASHVATCRACQAILADWEALEPSPLTPAESQRIRARVFAAVPSAANVSPRPHPATVGPRASWWPLGLAAIGLLFALVAGVVVWRLETSRLSPRQPVPVSLSATPVFRLDKPPVDLPAALIWRGAPGAQPAWQEPLRRALQPYRADDYAAAAGQLVPLVRRFPLQPQPAFYLGVSQLFLGQNTAAAVTLAQAAQHASGALADSVQWYRSLAFIRGGQPAQAQATLTRLCRGGGLYATRACVGLQALAAAPR